MFLYKLEPRSPGRDSTGIDEQEPVQHRQPAGLVVVFHTRKGLKDCFVG